MSVVPITTEKIYDALRNVNDPELHKDLVTLNMIKDLEIVGGLVKFRIVLTTPACPLKAKIEANARQAVLSVSGVKSVEIKMDSSVPTDGRNRGLMKLPVKNAIAVASGKGGVGKSTVAVNLAVSLAQMGAKVGLMDADIYGPNTPTMMGVNKLPAFQGEKIIPAQAYGVKLMSIGFMVKPGQPLIWRGPMVHSSIRQFLSDLQFGELDYLVIDLPPGTGDAQLSHAQSLPLSGVVVVTLPQDVSVEDANRGLAMFKELNVPILGVIENMSYLELPDGQKMEIFGSGGGEKLAAKEEVEFLGKIPMEASVRIGGDQGVPVVVSLPDSPSAKIMNNFATRLAAKLSVAALDGKGGIKIDVIE
jgi:ATP-binding protein involved in chromosome partitioning